MEQISKENTLFLGNGFSRSVFRDVPSWGKLFDGEETSVRNYAILYEKFLLKKRREGKSEEEVKKELVGQIKKCFSGSDIIADTCNLAYFGTCIRKYHINNILTTNYDGGIEFILCKFCGYKEEKPNDMIAEKIYSIRTYRLFVDDKSGHKIKLWKIHGDLDRIRSITLGFDHYCGTLSKLSEYIKGSYSSSQTDRLLSYAGSMIDKCKSQKFDDISWVDLFFSTDLYIVGFGLDFSEIDIWWLLNKRARMMVDIKEINNRIVYLYNEKYELPHFLEKGKEEESKNQQAKFETLKAFSVAYYPLKTDADYIHSVFTTIEQCIDNK